jgi:hypothetical protein
MWGRRLCKYNKVFIAAIPSGRLFYRGIERSRGSETLASYRLLLSNNPCFRAVPNVPLSRLPSKGQDRRETPILRYNFWACIKGLESFEAHSYLANC